MFLRFVSRLHKPEFGAQLCFVSDTYVSYNARDHVSGEVECRLDPKINQTTTSRRLGTSWESAAFDIYIDHFILLKVIELYPESVQFSYVLGARILARSCTAHACNYKCHHAKR